MNPCSLHGVGRPARADDAPVAKVAGTGVTLDGLPNPRLGAMSGTGMNDAMSLMYELLAKDGQTQFASRRHEIDGHRLEQHKKLEEHRAALERQRKAEGEGSTGFFGSLVKIVKDVADDAIHLRVADCVSDFKDDCAAAWQSPRFWQDLESGAGSIAKVFNTAMAVTTALLSLHGDDAVDIVKNPGSLTARHYGLAGRSLLVLGAGIATTATGGGAAPLLIAASAAAMSAGGEAIAETKCLGDASVYVGLGLDVGGAALTLGFANTSDAQKIVNALRGAAMMLQGAGLAVEGTAHIRVTSFQADAESAATDAKAATQQMDRLGRLIKFVLTEAKDVQKSHERALASLRGAMETNNQTLLVAAGVRG